MSVSDRTDNIAETPRTADHAASTIREEAAQLLQSGANDRRTVRQQEPLELIFTPLAGVAASDQTSPAQSRTDGSRPGDPKHSNNPEKPVQKKPDAPDDKGAEKRPDKPSAGDRTTPEQVQPRQIDNLEVANGTNDISEQLGKGARLVRGNTSDVLTLPSGYRIEVRKDNVNRDGVAMIVIRDASGRQTADLRIGKNDTPIANINDGAARTMIRVTQNGQIETIRTNGKTFRLVPPKLD